MTTVLAPHAYWNGRFVASHDIYIDPMDVGVLRGYGVFDVMRTECGKPFLIERHWVRLVRSAKTLGLTLPVDFDKYCVIIEQLVRDNALPQATIRTVLTGGASDTGFLPEPGAETFYIVLMPFLCVETLCFTEGATLMTLEYARSFPYAKITNYITALAHARERVARGALEILFVQNGLALEASTSNYMMVQEGRIITPRENILGGITRGLVLELAREHGYAVEERPVTLAEVLAADEVFLTATNKYVVPIVRIDDTTIGTGKPGPVTQALLAAVRAYVAAY